MLNPLEFFLFVTFLVYSVFSRPLLGLVYLLLLLLFSRLYARSPLPSSFMAKWKASLTSILFLMLDPSSEPKFYIRVKYDITSSLERLRQWNSSHATKLTITHVALKALSAGMDIFESTYGRIAFGNVGRSSPSVQERGGQTYYDFDWSQGG